jgi:hypothetical protein
MDNWAKFESILREQEQAGGPVDSVIEVEQPALPKQVSTFRIEHCALL